MLSSLPPLQRGNVEKDAIGPGSEPMEPEEELQGSSQKEPLSHGIGRMCRPDNGDAQRSPPVPVAGPLIPTGAGSPGPDGTGASPDDDWDDRHYSDSDRPTDEAADADIDVNWDDVSSNSSVHGHRGRDDESSNRSQPATKRSRSTQVSDEFVKRSVEPSPEATTGTATNDTHLTQLQRLEVIVDLLESLARSGLPTLINSFQRR